MTGGSRLCHGDGDLSGVPVGHVIRRFQLPNTVGLFGAVFAKALLDAGEIVLIGVHHQRRLAVRRLDQILQGIQLPVIDDAHIVELVVAGSICQLQQLPGQRRGVERQDVAIRVGQQHIAFHLPVQLFFPRRQLQLHHIVDAVWHLDVVAGLHGHADVADPLVDLFLRAWLQLVLVGQPAVRRREEHINVRPHRPTEALSLVQQE